MEDLHSKCHVCHFDLSPNNILFRNDSPSLTLIDFGMAHHVGCGFFKTFRESSGTKLFASLAIHQKTLAGYIADVESLAYLLHFLETGSLPWTPYQSWDEVLVLKLQFYPSNPSIKLLLQYCRSFPQTELPNYNRLRGFFMTSSSTVDFDFVEGFPCEIIPSLRHGKKQPPPRSGYVFSRRISPFKVALKDKQLTEVTSHIDLIRKLEISDKLSLYQLQSVCRIHQLDTSGTKAKILQRLASLVNSSSLSSLSSFPSSSSSWS